MKKEQKSMTVKHVQFQMRAPEELLSRVDSWRIKQPGIPGRAEAIRRILDAALAGERKPTTRERK
jgi:metal-responsive CopG/Arc/MetJ family transcriptional regulator